MNIKIITIGALVVFALFGLMLWGESRTANTPQISNAASALAASDAVHDFGTISMADGVVSHTFTITNETGSDIEVKTIDTSCMCTTAYIESENGEKGPFGMRGMGYLSRANEVIQAGKSRNVKVVFDPNAHGPAGVGQIDRFVHLTDKSGGTLQLEITAVVTP
jgi:hypothetical protein